LPAPLLKGRYADTSVKLHEHPLLRNKFWRDISFIRAYAFAWAESKPLDMMQQMHGTYQKKAILQWCSWYLSSNWKTNQDASKQCVSAGLAQGTRQHISSTILQVFKDAQEQFCNCTFSRWWHRWSISVALILWWCPTTNPIWLDKNSVSAKIFMSWLAQETSVGLQSLTRNKKPKEMKWINSPSKK
jgi:hypothetical protein